MRLDSVGVTQACSPDLPLCGGLQDRRRSSSGPDGHDLDLEAAVAPTHGCGDSPSSTSSCCDQMMWRKRQDHGIRVVDGLFRTNPNTIGPSLALAHCSSLRAVRLAYCKSTRKWANIIST
jgi:hypothetical protein